MSYSRIIGTPYKEGMDIFAENIGSSKTKNDTTF